MTHIDVTLDALGQQLRVEGDFTPSRPGRTWGAPDQCYEGDPAEWGEVTVTLADGGDDLCALLDRLRAPGYVGTALDHVCELAELAWLRQRDGYSEAA